MRHFFHRVLVFISIPLALMSVIFFAFHYSHRVNESSLKLPQEVNVLYAGDSHIQKGVDDQYIGHSKNIAQTSEAYYFTYYKLAAIFEYNPQIERVYLGFSNHNFSDYYEDVIDGEYKSIFAAYYYHLLPLKEQLHFLRVNADNISPFIENIMEETDKAKEADLPYYMGNFANEFNQTRMVDSIMMNRIKTQYFAKNEGNQFSELNYEYFTKIIDLCESQSIELVLLNTPLHPKYSAEIPTQFTNLLDSIQKVHSIEYINLSKMELEEVDYIPDGDHVSAEGSVKLSKRLNEIELGLNN